MLTGSLEALDRMMSMDCPTGSDELVIAAFARSGRRYPSIEEILADIKPSPKTEKPRPGSWPDTLSPFRLFKIERGRSLDLPPQTND
jgi:hypothetical protein